MKETFPRSMWNLPAGMGFPCLLPVFLLLWGCQAPVPPPAWPTEASDPIAPMLIGSAPEEEPSSPEEANRPIGKMGFSIQVGAFANLDNAVRLESLLEGRGIEAYHFRHESGLYKVRFGNFSAYQPARDQAEALQAMGVIDRFFIVIPEDYAAARIERSGQGDLRNELVRTARQFLGIPYRWGGETENGFDCSGLTMVSYRLNGLNLPRNSRSQFQAGHWVAKDQLRPGDLVFFATKGGRRVTHVGMFIGNGEFIHAPRPGKTVRIEKLSSGFFSETYMGGRSYL